MANFRTNRFGNISIQSSPNESSIRDVISQPAHIFDSGAAVYFNSNGYLQAGISNSITESSVIGLVESVSGDNVNIVYQGEIVFPQGANTNYAHFPLVTGNTYYLSSSFLGGITAGYAPDQSSIIKPLMISTGAYKGVVINSLPLASTPIVTLFTPVGSIVPYVGMSTNIPSGWLLCAGDAIIKQGSYADLYDAVKENYGAMCISSNNSSGLTAFITFDDAISDPPTSGIGSTKNHNFVQNDVFKLMWGSNQSVVRVANAVPSSSDVTLSFVKSISGSTSFNSLGTGTELKIGSLVAGEVTGHTSDKFFIPDLRGRVIVGAGTGRGLTNKTIGNFGGEESHSLTISELPEHTHELQLLSSMGISGSSSVLLGSSQSLFGTSSSFPQSPSPTTSVRGSGDSHENMPPYLVTNWIVRYRKNTGMAGIETGPRGIAGQKGDTGLRGVTGSQGSVGATGTGLGALHYTYTNTANAPSGYWSESDNFLILSNQEYYGSSVGDYISSCMNNTNSQRNSVVIIRSLKSPKNFSRIYSLKGKYSIISATGQTDYLPTATDTPRPPLVNPTAISANRFKLPVDSVLSSYGYPVQGELYSVIILPSSNDGVRGATGPAGVQGLQGPTGERGIPGKCGCTAEASVGRLQKYDDQNIYLSPFGNSLGYGSYVSAPHGVSTKPNSSTNWSEYLAALDGSFSQYNYSEDILSPILFDSYIKRNFQSSLQITSQACGGSCSGATGYVSLCDSVRRADNLNYYNPPKQTNIGLVPTSANTVFYSSVTNVVDGCSINVFGTTGSYFKKIPAGLSAGFADSVTGSTGRNVLILDIFMNTSNVVVGNYLGIRPEYFSLGLTAGFTGNQTLSGIYKVSSVEGDFIRTYGSVPFGSSNSTAFTGYISGGISGNINNVDVYKLSVSFKDCSGYLVSSGQLSLGLTAYGYPFVVVFEEQSNNTSQSSKAISAINSGRIKLGDGMAFYGWPKYGSALYANYGGKIEGENQIISSCGIGVASLNKSAVVLKTPVISSTDCAIFTDSGGSVKIFADNSNKRTSIVRNGCIGTMDSSSIEILDSSSILQSDLGQKGFLFAKNSNFVIGGGNEAAALGATGATGLSGWCMGASGGSAAFVISSKNSSGNITIIAGNGNILTACAGSNGGDVNFTASLGRGKIAVRSGYSTVGTPFADTLVPFEAV